MALDGCFLYHIKAELEQHIGARVDRIYQPAKDEILLVLRWKGGSGRLLLSANANNARIHWTELPPENPKVPPMFCMFLRKRLGSGKLVAVRQLSLDRVLYLDFETTNELGDLQVLTLSVEIMGRHSNLILIDGEGVILDAVKRVDRSMSALRPVLPGARYLDPPLQDKLNLLNDGTQEVLERLQASPHLPLSKALLQTIQGISPILARELADRVCQGEDPHAAELTAGQQGALAQTLQLLMRCLTAHQPHYTVLLEGGKPKDFSFFPIRQYGDYLEQKTFATAGELLDYFYVERDRIARMKQRSHDLIKLLNNTAERISRKLDLQQQELDQSAKRDEFRVYGELLNANLYRLQKGQTQALVENFYQENKPVSIPLDPLLTPAQNAQKYFNSYKKAVHAEKKLTSLVEQSQQDLAYIQSVLDLVLRTGSETELRELRQELAEQGYLKQKQLPGKTLGASQPICYRSSDGFLIRCGRNNKQNDALTFRLSKGDDLWLHVKNIPGSHVVIQSGGRPIPDRTIQEGCVLAAYNSKARESAQVPVDYTFVRYVKKPNGAKPGMVIFTNQRTAYVTPSAQLEQQLREPTDG